MKTTKRTTRTEITRTETTTNIQVVEEEGSDTVWHARGEAERELPRRLPHDRRVGPTETAWHHLQTFFIEYPPRAGGKNKMETVPQVKVFANGRQQVKVRVVLSPRNASGAYVSVPESELKAMVNLIDYNTGELLPGGWTAHWDENEYSDADWAISNAPGKSSSNYVPHDNRPQGKGGLAPDQVAVTYYVTCDRVDSLRIAASVKPPQASQPIETRPGASGNQFDSSVNVDARPPLNLPPSNFQHRWGDHSDNSFFTIHNVYITLLYNGRRINLLHVADAGGVINGTVNVHADNGDFKITKSPGSGGAVPGASWEGVFTTCAKEHGAGTSFYDIPDYLSNYYVYNNIGGVENYEEGAILYMQHLFRPNWHFTWGYDGSDPPDVFARNVIFIDEFGNGHRVRVGDGDSSIGGDFYVISNW